VDTLDVQSGSVHQMPLEASSGAPPPRDNPAAASLNPRRMRPMDAENLASETPPVKFISRREHRRRLGDISKATELRLINNDPDHPRPALIGRRAKGVCRKRERPIRRGGDRAAQREQRALKSAAPPSWQGRRGGSEERGTRNYQIRRLASRPALRRLWRRWSRADHRLA
jgi:hypothetical protein